MSATPLVLALRGELGAGKSVLARAVARGAGVVTPIPSPTFNLLFTYEAPERSIRVFHLDLYRLRSPEEVWELGWRELGDERQIVLIEWPERAEQILPLPRWDIELLADEGKPNLRQVKAHRIGSAPDLPRP
jgi:tRNA threonylcarbamoyladenosine biosynthesis protein TsaE